MKVERLTFNKLANFTDKQKEALDALSKYDYVLYGGAMGGGKALREEELILTPFGYRKMKDLRVGDIILNPDGSYQKVIGKFPQGEREVYRVWFDDGGYLDCDLEHLWLVKENQKITKRNYDWRVWTTEMIMKKIKKGKVVVIPYTKPLKFTKAYKKEQIIIHPYVLGVLIGDGCFKGGVSLYTNDKEIIEKIKKLGYKVVKSKSKYRYGIYNLKSRIKKLGLYNLSSLEKFIPKPYLFASVEKRWALLQGLMDTDGTVDKRGHLSYSTSSEKLAYDVQFLVRTLGGRARINKKKTDKNLNYVVQINFSDKAKVFGIKRKKDRVKNPAYLNRKIVKIEKVGKDRMMCITVDHPNGLFVAGKDVVVTHNSYLLRWAALKFLLLCHIKLKLNRVMVGLFCEDYPSLKDRQISKIQMEFPTWLGDLHNDHKSYGRCFILKPEYGSGVIAFRNLDDPSKYKSAEFAMIAVDELSQNKKDIFNFLRTRKRWPRIKRTKFIAATNPGGIGHNWIKKMWMLRQFEPYEKEADQFYFVKATAYDNPHLEESYFNSLSGLPYKMREAYLNGNWDVFEGQFFTEWRENKHVKVLDVPADSRFIISLDYGFAKPSAVLFWAIFPNGFCYCFDEIYIVGESYDGITELIRTKILKYGIRVENILADPAIFGDRQHHRYAISGESGGEYIQAKLTLPVIAADNRRIVGWNRMRIFLESGMCAWHPRCENCIRTIPTLVHDDVNPEDVDTNCEDHAGDAARYFFMSRPTPKIKKATISELIVGENPDNGVILKPKNKRQVAEIIKMQLSRFKEKFNKREYHYRMGTGRWN